MIRQAAFAAGKKKLKGALHCHTTRSDGSGTPEEVIRLHAANGYDFMAITDHRKYNHMNFAPDVDMLIVPGAENDREIYGDGGIHCFHTVCVGPSVSDGNGYGQDHAFVTGKVADQFEFQFALDEYHANNNMTIYCHPEWSSTPAREFEKLRGNFAMEIWNSGCAMTNEMDTNAAYWDELLMQNIRISGVATDDGHHMDQHCVGWVVVNAERELNAVLAALREGAFYSSCGPELYDFYIDNGTAVVECSPCAAVSFHYGRNPTHVVTDSDNPGNPALARGLISRAEYKAPGYLRYLRASVRDGAGRRAWSNPIYLK